MTALVLLTTLSVSILVHELGHFLMARRFGVRVERFSIGFGPVLLKWRPGETEYALSLLPLGGYVKMAGEQPAERTGAAWEYGSRPVWQRAAIVVVGPLVNYVTGILLFTAVFWIGAPTLMPVVGEVMAGYPAARAGFQSGDRLVAIDGRPVDTWEAVTARVRRQVSGAAIQILIRRAGQEQTVTVHPQVKTGPGVFGHATRVAVIGMTPSGEVQLVRLRLPAAAAAGIRRTWTLTVLTYQSFWQMVTGVLPLKESLTGPVGIFYLTSSAAHLGRRYLAQLFPVLSVSLAIFNLLPIPALDGGHLAFLGWEGLRRRPASLRVQETMGQVGMVMLLGMLLMVTYNDLAKYQVVQRVTHFFR